MFLLVHRIAVRTNRRGSRGQIIDLDREVRRVARRIGRLEDCEVSLPHKSVSRRHARIIPTDNGYEIEDLGSVNGTWVNDRPISDRAALEDGDQVMIGDVPLAII